MSTSLKVKADTFAKITVWSIEMSVLAINFQVVMSYSAVVLVTNQSEANRIFLKHASASRANIKVQWPT